MPYQAIFQHVMVVWNVSTYLAMMVFSHWREIVENSTLDMIKQEIDIMESCIGVSAHQSQY